MKVHLKVLGPRSIACDYTIRPETTKFDSTLDPDEVTCRRCRRTGYFDRAAEAKLFPSGRKF